MLVVDRRWRRPVGSTSGFQARQGSERRETAESAKLRPILATVAWQMFVDRPLLGCGFGQYPEEQGAYLVRPFDRSPLEKVRPYVQHNVFLGAADRNGARWAGTVRGGLGCCGLAQRLAAMAAANPWAWGRARCGLLFLMPRSASTCPTDMFHDVSLIPMVNMLLFFLAGVSTGLAASASTGVARPAANMRHGPPASHSTAAGQVSGWPSRAARRVALRQAITAGNHPRHDVGLQHGQQADEAGQHDAVQKNEPQDLAFAARSARWPPRPRRCSGRRSFCPSRRRCCSRPRSTSGLRPNCSAVIRCKLPNSAFDEVSDAGQRHAQPPQQRRKERIQRAGLRECQPERGVAAAVFGGEGQRQHAGDREQGPAHLRERFGRIAARNSPARSAAKTPTAPRPGKCRCRWPRAN